MSFYSVSEHIYSFIPKEFTSGRYGVYPGETNVLSGFHVDNPTISNNNKSAPLFNENKLNFIL